VTLLAPDLVDVILDGWQPAQMTLAVLMRPFAVGWTKQPAPHLAPPIFILLVCHQCPDCANTATAKNQQLRGHCSCSR
jgi:hypothetical protein